MTNEEIRSRLFALQDVEYKKFQLKLIPGVEEDRVIGVRTPQLRALAKEIFRSKEYDAFIAELPHQSYDEMNLHGFILCEIKDYDTVVRGLDRFLPHVDNWATCDLLSPKKAFSKNLSRLEEDIVRWMASGETYTIRFGMEMLMSFYLDDAFKPEYLSWIAEFRSEEYYVNMMRAWFMATALAKQYDAAIGYIERKELDDWTHRKSIQKACESYRITPEQKEHLRSLK